MATFELLKHIVEQPNFELQHIHRTFEIITKENDSIQLELYKNSLSIIDRATDILYYDCTNDFFEIEDDFRKYWSSKEERR